MGVLLLASKFSHLSLRCTMFCLRSILRLTTILFLGAAMRANEVLPQDGTESSASSTPRFSLLEKELGLDLIGEAFADDEQEDLEAFRKGDSGPLRKRLLASAGEGNATAALLLGQIYLTGEGVEKNPTLARTFFSRAAHGGDIRGAYNFALLLLPPLAVEPDLPEALKWLRLAAEGGLAEAHGTLGRLAEARLPLEGARDEAILHYRAAAAGGDTHAMVRLGQWIERGDMPSSDPLTEAFNWHLRAVEAGDPFAMFELGRYYEAGLGRPQDPERARSWYREAARRGVAVAQLQLGLLLQQEGNPDEAFGWIEAAARQGLPTALLQLGLAHERGRGGPVDLSLAAQSYRRAATELDEARLLLSRLLIKEFGQPADLAEAAALLAGLDSEAAQTLRALLLPGDQTSP